MTTQIGTFVGATGGAGTTRLTVECAAVLARAGHDVAVFDAALQTQGLASYATTDMDADVTALLTGEADLEAVLSSQPIDGPGSVAFAPSRAPFERLARAKTAGAAERFEQHLAAATLSYDVVLVDAPPVGGNQAIAALNAADDVGIVVPDSARGDDGLALARERLADIGVSPDAVVANRGPLPGDPADSPVDADVTVPRSETTDPRACPAAVPPDGTFTPAILAVIEAVLDRSPDVEIPDGRRFAGLLDR